MQQESDNPLSASDIIENAFLAMIAIVPASFIYGIFFSWFIGGSGGNSAWYFWFRDWLVTSLAICIVAVIVSLLAALLWGVPVFRLLVWMRVPELAAALISGSAPGMLLLAMDIWLGATVLYFGLVAGIAFWLSFKRRAASGSDV